MLCDLERNPVGYFAFALRAGRELLGLHRRRNSCLIQSYRAELLWLWVRVSDYASGS